MPEHAIQYRSPLTEFPLWLVWRLVALVVGAARAVEAAITHHLDASEPGTQVPWLIAGCVASFATALALLYLALTG
ncbi:MAG: hypothetical protein GEU83_12090 [Pseudonocardiaceae bacterium]|nr:hypothetical protein [Pseudonocardiaceae bacterium]